MIFGVQNYLSHPVPLPEVFDTTRPDPVPKSKTTTRQSLVTTSCSATTPNPNPSRTPTKIHPFHTTTYLTHYTNSFPFPTHGPAAK